MFIYFQVYAPFVINHTANSTAGWLNSHRKNEESSLRCILLTVIRDKKIATIMEYSADYAMPERESHMYGL